MQKQKPKNKSTSAGGTRGGGKLIKKGVKKSSHSKRAPSKK
jgi:hypothetical protein